MEAHNGISAKLVEEAGFRGIWASSLTASASLGVRDSNEVSWTQILDLLEFIVDSTSLPVLVDGEAQPLAEIEEFCGRIKGRQGQPDRR